MCQYQQVKYSCNHRRFRLAFTCTVRGFCPAVLTDFQMVREQRCSTCEPNSTPPTLPTPPDRGLFGMGPVPDPATTIVDEWIQSSACSDTEGFLRWKTTILRRFPDESIAVLDQLTGQSWLQNLGNPDFIASSDNLLGLEGRLLDYWSAEGPTQLPTSRALSNRQFGWLIEWLLRIHDAPVPKRKAAGDEEGSKRFNAGDDADVDEWWWRMKNLNLDASP